MINFVTMKGRDNERILPMEEMKPLQVARIVEECHHKGHIVMRTASESHFEIMDLTDCYPNSCWTNELVDITVELLKAGEVVVLEVSNED